MSFLTEIHATTMQTGVVAAFKVERSHKVAWSDPQTRQVGQEAARPNSSLDTYPHKTTYMIKL